MEFGLSLSFAHEPNDVGLLCGDSVILQPNFGSDMMSIFCGEFKLDDMWDIIGNICERAHGNLWACVWSICEGPIIWRIFG